MQSTVTVDIFLGTTAVQVDSVYGIAFTLSYDPSLVDPAFTSTDFSNTWMGTSGTDFLTFDKKLSATGMVDVALTRTNHTNVSGSGHVGSLSIVTTDNLSGIVKIDFGVSGIKAVTRSGNLVSFNALPDSVVVDPALTGINDVDSETIRLFPNPASGLVRIISPVVISNAEVRDVAGRLISSQKSGSNEILIDVSGYRKGIYFLDLKTYSGNRIIKRLEVIK